MLDEFRRKEKTAVIFFNIEKAWDKINRHKTFQQLKNMEIHRWKMEFIKELISESERNHFFEQTERSGNPTGGVISVIHFLVSINDILEKLVNGVDGSFFADHLSTYCILLETKEWKLEHCKELLTSYMHEL